MTHFNGFFSNKSLLDSVIESNNSSKVPLAYVGRHHPYHLLKCPISTYTLR